MTIAMAAEAAASKAADADVPVNEPVTPTEPVHSLCPRYPGVRPGRDRPAGWKGA